MSSLVQKPPRTLAVALGANLPSEKGLPRETLIAVRPKLEKEIYEWALTELVESKKAPLFNEGIRFRWSPLFETTPVGGPPNQKNYINAVVVIDGKMFSSITPSEESALSLLDRFLNLENEFGRKRHTPNIKWGPRSLDLDLLAWGDLHVHHDALTLPHPRLIERSFVVIPLAAALTEHTKTPRKLTNSDQWD